MPPTETSLNKAHQYASNAEDYLNQGLLIPAAEEHYKSAEAFLQCVEQASDEGTKRTLRMLYNEHNKSGKELQRRIAKLKEEGKDPSLPQLSSAPLRERGYVSPFAENPPTSSSSLRGRMGDSNHTIDESYMLLGQQLSDPADAFTQFWKVLEGMLDNLSQPVAFATAPLARPELRQSVSISDRNPDKLSNNRAIGREGASGGNDLYVESPAKSGSKTTQSGHSKKERSYPVSNVPSTHTSSSVQEAMGTTIVSDVEEALDAPDSEEVFLDSDSPTTESFFVIPSVTGPSLSTRLQKENTSLKDEVTTLQQRLEVAERMRVEQEQQIRDKISYARREAHRAMNSSFLQQRAGPPSLDLSALNLNAPPLSAFPGPMNGARDRESQLMRKIKELEEEVRAVRTENEKQKAMIVKFRERWEKLKESAKRKRTAKANAALDSIREQRIDEEPEAEQTADDG